MEEQELDRIRAEALSKCRQLCEAEAQADNRLQPDSIFALIGSNLFAEQIFLLVDHKNEGAIENSVLVELFKYNFG
jgi:hypothetical protein